MNILDGDKRTPIYYARRHGHQEAVQILIANSCVDDSSDNGSIDAVQQSWLSVWSCDLLYSHVTCSLQFEVYFVLVLYRNNSSTYYDHVIVIIDYK